MRRVARSESAALTKTHCGIPKGIRPFGALLPPLLGAGQEVAIRIAPRVVRRTKDRKLNFKQLLLRSARPRWVCLGKSFYFLRLPLVVAKLEAQH